MKVGERYVAEQKDVVNGGYESLYVKGREADVADELRDGQEYVVLEVVRVVKVARVLQDVAQESAEVGMNEEVA